MFLLALIGVSWRVVSCLLCPGAAIAQGVQKVAGQLILSYTNIKKEAGCLSDHDQDLAGMNMTGSSPRSSFWVPAS